MGKVATITLALLIAGCATTGGSFCDIAKPLRPSPAIVDAMSDREVKDMLAHNEKGRKLCGWKR